MSKATSSKAARGRKPFSKEGRPRVCGHRTITGTPTPAHRAVRRTGHWRAVRPRPSRPCPAAGGGLPGRQLGRLQPGDKKIERDRGPGCGLGSRAPDVLRGRRDPAGAHPRPGISEGASLPRSSKARSAARKAGSLARLGPGRFGGPGVQDAQGRRCRQAAEGRAPGAGL